MVGHDEGELEHVFGARKRPRAGKRLRPAGEASLHDFRRRAPAPLTAEERAAAIRRQCLQDPDPLKSVLGVAASDAFELSTQCRAIISGALARHRVSLEALEQAAPAFRAYHKCAHQLTSVAIHLLKYDK